MNICSALVYMYMYTHICILLCMYIYIYSRVFYMYSKDFPKEIYNTYAKSCNSNWYTKYPSATYSGLVLGTMCCL